MFILVIVVGAGQNVYISGHMVILAIVVGAGQNVYISGHMVILACSPVIVVGRMCAQNTLPMV